jgi:hypothetical protein
MPVDMSYPDREGKLLSAIFTNRDAELFEYLYDHEGYIFFVAGRFDYDSECWEGAEKLDDPTVVGETLLCAPSRRPMYLKINYMKLEED